MEDKSKDILNRNLLVRMVEDELHLPCAPPIVIKLQYTRRAGYILCQATGLDPASGLLTLVDLRDPSLWNAEHYAISVQANSRAIIDAGVTTFTLLGLSLSAAERRTPFEWKPTAAVDDWTPIPSPRRDRAGINDIEPPIPSQPQPALVSEKFQIAIQDLTFDNGIIRITRFVNTRLGELSFEIAYPTSRKEYDSVKEYFEKVLKLRTVACEVKVEISGRQILSKSANFIPDDPFPFAVIEQVKDYSLQDIILNSDEPVSIVEEKLKLLGILDDSERNFEGMLERLSKFKKSKHYYFLRHLSSLHDAETFRLRLTGKPVSFIFVIKGTLNYFLIWETYETEEATYIWRLENSHGPAQRQEMTDLVEKIKWLREKNKILYLKTAPAHFKRIEHDYSQPDGGIEKWKRLLSAHVF